MEANIIPDLTFKLIPKLKNTTTFWSVSHNRHKKQDNVMEPANHCNTQQNQHLKSCNTYRTNIQICHKQMIHLVSAFRFIDQLRSVFFVIFIT